MSHHKCVKDKCVKDKCVKDKCVKDKCVKDKCVKDKYVKDKYVKDKYVKDKYVKDKYVKDKYVKDKCVKDKCVKDKCVKDKCVKDKCVKDKTLRFLHNIIDAPTVSIYLDNILLVGSLSYKEITAYLSINQGTYYISVKNDNTTLVSEKINLKNTSTIVISGTVSGTPIISLLHYTDNLLDNCPQPGYFKLKFLHVAYSVPAVDIYLSDVKIFSDIHYTESTTYITHQLGLLNNSTNPEYYNVSVKLAGTDTTVIGPISIYFISGGVYSIFATGTVTNKLNAILSHDNPNQCEVLQPNFDTQKYMGLWYQIASIPQFYDMGCVRSTALYSLLQDNVNVFNTCYQTNGSTNITGSAYAPNLTSPASLIVTFTMTPVVSVPNYLIHETNYEYAIVGSSSRLSLYILSREKSMTTYEYNYIMEKVKKLGYNLSKIKPDQGAIKC
jgi:apolipoprotein D and lipocalin family protein